MDLMGLNLKRENLQNKEVLNDEFTNYYAGA
ncbi:hypothetical protein ABIE66_005928 [Peribacillus sp. B2I2]